MQPTEAEIARGGLPSAPAPAGWRFWRWSENNRILAGFALGTAAGLTAKALLPASARLQWFLDQVAAPVGEVFLRLIFMVIIPLLISAFILGVTGLRSWDRLKRLGGRYVALVLLVAVAMAGSGLLVEKLVRPGRFVSAEQKARLAERYGVEAAEDEVRAKEFPGLLPAIVGLIPDNPVRHLGQALTVHDQGMGLPALLVFSLFFSVAILLGPAEVMDVVLRFIRGLFAVSMNIVNLAIRLTPFCIVFVAFNFAARLGFDLMSSLSMYVATFFLGWLAAYAVLFPLLLSLFGGRSALDFYRRIKEPFWFAFVTSSSSATYPLALETAKEKLGIPESTARFVLTLGAVANQTGSTLFAVVSSLFLADVFGVRLSGAQQLEILALGVAVAFATPGVPGGDLPLLATFCLLFGIPTRAVALVIGVNRLLDVGVTTINVGGDLVVASILGRGERGKGEGAIP